MDKEEITHRKSIFSDLKDYCPFSKGDDFIEVTEWSNGEGFDVKISSFNDRVFSFTHGEFELIKELVLKIDIS